MKGIEDILYSFHAAQVMHVPYDDNFLLESMASMQLCEVAAISCALRA